MSIQESLVWLSTLRILGTYPWSNVWALNKSSSNVPFSAQRLRLLLGNNETHAVMLASLLVHMALAFASE
jgi:hypothetical protein